MAVPRKHSVCSPKEEHDLELKSFTELFKCDGCKQQGSGKRYRCEHCGYQLHEDCMYPKDTTSHDLFGGVVFQFFPEPQLRCWKLNYNCDKDHRRRCDACSKDILGFSYQSVDKKWDLHPLCSKLEKKILIQDTLFELCEKVPSRCNWCKEKKISGGKRSWSYVSRCRDWNFHVYCLMEMGNNLALQKIELRHLANKTKKNRRSGNAFFSTIKVFLTTVLSILLGDPTALLASTLIELIAPG